MFKHDGGKRNTKTSIQLVPMLRRMPAAEVGRRQRALAAARPQILFDVPNASAAAANLFGLAAERCFPRMLKCGAFHLNELRTAEGKAAVLAAAPPPAPTREWRTSR